LQPHDKPIRFILKFDSQNSSDPLTGSIGHSDISKNTTLNKVVDYVSIPDGLHRPFSPDNPAIATHYRHRFQSLTGSTGHLASV
jgi:hypothetical protein